MKKAILLLFLAAGFIAGAQNFYKEYPFWNSDYGDQFVYPNSNGYATVGIKNVTGIYSLVLIQTNLNGDTLFTKTLVDTLSYTTLSRTIADADGFNYISFSKNDSACVARFSPEWNLQWIRKFGFASDFRSMTINRNNALLLAGITLSEGGKLYLYCLKPSGDLSWETSIMTRNFESPINIFELENGDISILVEMWNFYAIHYADLNIYNFSASGDSLSYRIIPLNGMYPLVNHIVKHNDTLAILYTDMDSGRTPLYYRQIKTNGTFIFEKEFSFSDTNYGVFNALLIPGKEMLITGAKEVPGSYLYRLFIVDITFGGDSLWSVDYFDKYNTDVDDIQLCSDGGYIISGNFGGSANRTVYLLKTDSLGYLNNLGIDNPFTTDIIRVYPNPATDNVVFIYRDAFTSKNTQTTRPTISITDIYGRAVAEIQVGGERTVWDSKGVAPGIYLYQTNYSYSTKSGKLIITR